MRVLILGLLVTLLAVSDAEAFGRRRHRHQAQKCAPTCAKVQAMAPVRIVPGCSDGKCNLRAGETLAIPVVFGMFEVVFSPVESTDVVIVN